MKTDLTLLALAVLLVCACASPSSPTTTTTTSTTTPSATPSAAPAMYQRFQSAVTVGIAGTQVVLKSTGLPDHKSPYWGAGNAFYEAPSPGMMLAPNTIASQNLTLRVPIAPTVATPSDTPLGAIGIAVNGVAIFNQYAAGRSPLGAEIVTFDRYNGHPQQTGQYHYHVEPLWLTGNNGASALIACCSTVSPSTARATRTAPHPRGSTAATATHTPRRTCRRASTITTSLPARPTSRAATGARRDRSAEHPRSGETLCERCSFS